MYVPGFNAMVDADVVAFLGRRAAGHLVTVGPDGIPDATLLPVLVDGGHDGRPVRLLGHLARANPHWTRIPAGAPGLVVVTGADAYVSPSWYASKATHGRVVPTWNYSEVQLRGAVTVHDDPDWVLDVVTRLTERHEATRESPWGVGDAPEAYVRGQLRGIVGIELLVDSVEGKAKLSQNRSEADRAGVVAGLRGEADAASHQVAGDMVHSSSPAPHP
ncbi:FMN-binding negative transcriptional regulator [Terrabacter sp. NPDC080008]|uniref:FMN-binding negative transcriptional regulator n=1 Tax=Terrabacter sp. NPDC080008 TaxID=3155176 RepID=UPI00344E8B0B